MEVTTKSSRAGTQNQHQAPRSDSDIAQDAVMRPILDLARDRLGISPEYVQPYGHTKAKLDLDFVLSLKDRPDGKLILVTAITPTPAGEGKTTTTVGLTDGLNYCGVRAVACLREPSLGPCFGMKGGAAGGGYAQVVPMTDINLHFTGDFHAITSANNLLAAMIDNHIYWGNALEIDQRRITWRRALDMNDRALRSIVGPLGGVANGFHARERVRHHRRLRGHGDRLSVARPRRSTGPARAYHRGLHARRPAGSCR